MYFIPSSSPDAACRIENESWQGFHLFYKKPLQLFKYSLCVSLNASLMLQRLLCLHTQKSTKLLTVVSCADSDGRDGVSSLAVTLFLSLRSQWQSVLFLAMAVQNQSSMMDSNNSGSSLSLTSRDLLHTLISHWINNLTQEKAQGVNQCLIWSWANSGGRSAFKRLDKRYYLDNKHSYRKRPYQMWNEYGLSKICFQLLLILCKVKALDDAVREGVSASYMQGYSIWRRWVLCQPHVLRVEKGMLETLLSSVGLFEKQRENYSSIIRFAKWSLRKCDIIHMHCQAGEMPRILAVI